MTARGLESRVKELEARLNAIQVTVNEQAEDEDLWFVSNCITEDMLQQALRHLHAVIEGEAI